MIVDGTILYVYFIENTYTLNIQFIFDFVALITIQISLITIIFEIKSFLLIDCYP